MRRTLFLLLLRVKGSELLFRILGSPKKSHALRRELIAAYRLFARVGRGGKSAYRRLNGRHGPTPNSVCPESHAHLSLKPVLPPSYSSFSLPFSSLGSASGILSGGNVNAGCPAACNEAFNDDRSFDFAVSHRAKTSLA